MTKEAYGPPLQIGLKMDIATRMKSYEDNTRFPKGTVIIRVDGRSFHTWTKKVKCIRPFDQLISSAMRYATYMVAKEMQGFKIAYTQSDEATFLISNLGEKEGAWFDYKAQKIASVTASLFTQVFNTEFKLYSEVFGRPIVPAYFDARAFSIPVHDAANSFVWRQQDWYRNSVQMLGHHYFSHSRMQGMTSPEVREALIEEHGVDWTKLDDWQKYGTFVIQADRQDLTTSVPLSYDEINRVTGLDRHLELMNDPNKT